MKRISDFYDLMTESATLRRDLVDYYLISATKRGRTAALKKILEQLNGPPLMIPDVYSLRMSRAKRSSSSRITRYRSWRRTSTSSRRASRRSRAICRSFIPGLAKR